MARRSAFILVTATHVVFGDDFPRLLGARKRREGVGALPARHPCALGCALEGEGNMRQQPIVPCPFVPSCALEGYKNPLVLSDRFDLTD